MKKKFLSIGNTLSRSEQKQVFGGVLIFADCEASCKGREPAKCSGRTCTVTDNIGCTSIDPFEPSKTVWCKDQPVLIQGI